LYFLVKYHSYLTLNYDELFKMNNKFFKMFLLASTFACLLFSQNIAVKAQFGIDPNDNDQNPGNTDPNTNNQVDPNANDQNPGNTDPNTNNQVDPNANDQNPGNTDPNTNNQVDPNANDQNPGNTDPNSNGQNPASAQIVQSVHDQVNQYRASQGLSALQLDSRITEQMQAYAQEMANAGRLLNHQGSDQRAQAVLNTIPHRGYAYYENEHSCSGGCNGDPATSAVRGWINSPGHRNNMLSNTELTGIGVAVDGRGQYYVAQMFIHAE
jgi:uncharacterized protein YkwD